MLKHIELLSWAAYKRITDSMAMSSTDDKYQQISMLLKEHNAIIANEVISYA